MGMTIDQLIALEIEVWDGLVRGDRAADERLLSDDFLGVYPTGFGDRSAHAGQLAGGPTVAAFELSEAQMLVISDVTALLAYRADYVRAGAVETESMYVSSLWCRRHGHWVNVFSQDTPDTGVEVV